MATVERLLLLRHARAGTKIPDPAQDFGRGLDRDGEAIAARLPVAVVHHLVPSEILSSPYRRCVDTVRPLAKTLGLTIVEDARLARRCSGPELRDILQQLLANAVICTHGEIIEKVFDDPVSCAKGAFWIIERRTGSRLVPALYVDAPTGA